MSADDKQRAALPSYQQQLELDLAAAIRDGNTWTERWCRERLAHWNSKQAHEPPAELQEPFEGILARAHAQAVKDGRHDSARLAEQVLEAERKAEEGGGSKLGSDADFWFQATHRQGRSACGWYVSYPDGPLASRFLYVCEDCTPKPYDGEKAKRFHVYALDPEDVFDGITCTKCKRQGREDRR